jgi:hypothetical protein
MELTSRALSEFKFSEDAISIASDAAQDPDFYEWYNPAAHAQTDCDLKTGATKDAANAVSAYLDWCVDKKKCFVSATNKEEALFFLGYLLHGVQDLASHQGVTNSQHAYESFVLCKNGKEDCDHMEVNRQKAQEYSQRLLAILATQKPDFFQSMKEFDAGFNLFGAKISKADKCKLLGKDDGWDLSVPAYMEYKGLADKYKIVKADNPVKLWDRDGVFNQLLAALCRGLCVAPKNEYKQ